MFWCLKCPSGKCRTYEMDIHLCQCVLIFAKVERSRPTLSRRGGLVEERWFLILDFEGHKPPFEILLEAIVWRNLKGAEENLIESHWLPGRAFKYAMALSSTSLTSWTTFWKSRHGRSGPGPTIVNFYMSQHVPPWVVSSSFVLLDRAASSFLSFLSAPLFFSCKMHLKWWCMVLFFAFCFLCSTFFFIVSGKGRTRLMWLGKVISGPRFEHLTNWGLRFRGHETPFSPCSCLQYKVTGTRRLLSTPHSFLFSFFSWQAISQYIRTKRIYCTDRIHNTNKISRKDKTWKVIQ